MRNGLGDAAPLDDFAKTYPEFFGEKVSGKLVQQRKVLELYAAYIYTPVSNNLCKLDPVERAAFYRVWNSESPDICVECASKLVDEDFRPYCGKECTSFNVTRACMMCGTKYSDDAQCCEFCSPTTKQGRAQGMHHAQNLWLSNLQKIEHEPAWKRQKRAWQP